MSLRTIPHSNSHSKEILTLFEARSKIGNPVTCGKELFKALHKGKDAKSLADALDICIIYPSFGLLCVTEEPTEDTPADESQSPKKRHYRVLHNIRRTTPIDEPRSNTESYSALIGLAGQAITLDPAFASTDFSVEMKAPSIDKLTKINSKEEFDSKLTVNSPKLSIVPALLVPPQMIAAVSKYAENNYSYEIFFTYKDFFQTFGEAYLETLAESQAQAQVVKSTYSTASRYLWAFRHGKIPLAGTINDFTNKITDPDQLAYWQALTPHSQNTAPALENKSNPQIVTILERQVQALEKQNSVNVSIRDQLNKPVSTGETKSWRNHLLSDAEWLVRLAQFKDPTDNFVFTEPCPTLKEFIEATDSNKVVLLKNFFQNKNLAVFTSKQLIINLSKGQFLNSTLGENLVFSIFQFFSPVNLGGSNSDISMVGEEMNQKHGYTEEQIARLSTKDHFGIAESSGAFQAQLKNMHGALVFAFGPQSFVATKYKIHVVDFITDNICKAEVQQEDNPKLYGCILAYADAVLQVFFKSIMSAKTPAEANLSVLNFDLLSQSFNNLATLPSSIPACVTAAVATSRKRHAKATTKDFDNADRSPKRARGTPLKGNKVTNPDPNPDWLLDDPTTFAKFNKEIRSCPKFNQHCGTCAKFQLKGECDSSCARKASHVKLTGQKATDFGAWCMPIKTS